MASCELCIERADYITVYLRNNEGQIENEKLQFAKAINYYLSHKKPIIRECNLIMGTLTSKLKGIHLYPEIGDLAIWRSLRMKGLKETEVRKLNEDIFPYWMKRDLATYLITNNENTQQLVEFMNQGFCKIEEYRGFIPDFRMILEQGLEKILKEVDDKSKDIKARSLNINGNKSTEEKLLFYESIKEIGDGLLKYVVNLGEKAKLLSEETENQLQKQIYFKMARTCSKIPAQAADSFYEAIQCIWFCIITMGAEYSLDGMSLGRLDQILYPYYEKDLLMGKVTREEAFYLIKELCTKLYECKNLKEESTLGITLGGINEKGEDGVNAVTYLFLRALKSLKEEIPVVNVRIHKDKNVDEYIKYAETISNEAPIIIQEDSESIKKLIRKGVGLESSRNYAVLADGILARTGLSYEGSQKLCIDVRDIFKLTLRNGRRQETGRKQWGPLTGEAENIDSFEEFLKAFQKQGEWFIKQSIASLEAKEEVIKAKVQWPFAAILSKGCLERGSDLINGGSIYADVRIRKYGIGETAKLLAYVEQKIFSESGSSFEKNLETLKDEKAYIQIDFDNISEKIILEYTTWIQNFLQTALRGYSNSRGGRYL
ncbi:pyruvate formate lyase family protein [Cellulosilyticum ruminicola]|uniref:pyruvate formate lyase family protein n=1 Tax=Cellulosilyticum ruminicola TaxID=425254 RepID=UPI0006CF44AA|nr:pyruvate formate lyase family protein [Cellulosilyticum ruminicola]